MSCRRPRVSLVVSLKSVTMTHMTTDSDPYRSTLICRQRNMFADLNEMYYYVRKCLKIQCRLL
jgi:hypothetical protein